MIENSKATYPTFISVGFSLQTNHDQICTVRHTNPNQICTIRHQSCAEEDHNLVGTNNSVENM